MRYWLERCKDLLRRRLNIAHSELGEVQKGEDGYDY
jgi:hypothetical protein